MTIAFDRTTCTALPGALSREWLETNGLGGYACSTIANCHTRKYHSLLSAVVPGLPGAYALVSQLEDILVTGDTEFPLVTHEYPGTYSPEGVRRQSGFELDLCPVFRYDCDGVEVERRIAMVHGQDTVLVRYDVRGAKNGSELVIRPLFAFRSVHDVCRANRCACMGAGISKSGFSFQAYDGLPTVFCGTNVRSEARQDPCWYYNVLYACDRERGFSHCEDLISPAVLHVPLRSGQPVILALSVHPLPGNLTALWKKEMTRREATRRSRDKRLARAHGRTGGEAALRLREALDAAADAFLVDKPGLGQTVHAGYPWFGTSGRDLLIALPGLTFARAQLDLGVEILESYAAHCRHGLLPLSLETDGTARCTAVDPGLWFFWTVQQYLAYGGDRERVRTTLWPVMKSVVESAMRGTDNDIWVTDTGLLHAGRAGECVTWMDACIGDRPVTPRWGLMVEINALWYNALRFALELGEELDDRIEDVDESFCAQVQESFEATFHDPLGPGLLDTVNEYFLDDGTRPNQILAVSLPYAVLAGDAARQVTETVGEELFTPCGLRSLSPRDNRYRGACRGDVWERDLAYHQGSAWPWLAAHYAEACLRVYGKDDKTRARFDELIQTFTARLDEAGLGSVSELFDGDPPHTARGAIAQAWNVGELIRMLDVLGVGRSA